jgi:hypothetical protein
MTTEGEETFVRITNQRIYEKLERIGVEQTRQGLVLETIAKDEEARDKKVEGLEKRLRSVELQVRGVFVALTPGLAMLVTILTRGRS